MYKKQTLFICTAIACSRKNLYHSTSKGLNDMITTHCDVSNQFRKIFGDLSSTVDKLHDLNWTFEIRSKKFVLRCRDLYLQNTGKLPNQTSYA